ncbi:MAG: hypothetical protein AAB456_02410 [Patescibacteria group bacterium]
MDPNTCLGEIRDLVDDIYRVYGLDDEQLAVQLSQKIVALDGWLNRGGFLPNDWRNNNLNQK